MLNRLLLVLTLLVLVWSGIHPQDFYTWLLEVFPVLLGIPLFFFIRWKYRITPLLVALLCIHAMILCVGGKYTYAQVPLGFYLKDLLGLARNNYDRIGHFAQGFVPAILFREWLLRKKMITSKIFLFIVVASFCLSFSAIYEFIEWGTSIASGSAGNAFLATQGDPWDTQWDMLTAFVASMLSQLLLARIHDRQLRTLI